MHAIIFTEIVFANKTVNEQKPMVAGFNMDIWSSDSQSSYRGVEDP